MQKSEFVNRIGNPRPEPLSKADYDFIVDRMPRLCVDLLIFNSQGEYLLSMRDIRPYNGLWHLPGGRVLFMESIQQTIERIAKKECGIAIGRKELIGYTETDDTLSEDHQRHSVSMVFGVEVGSGELKGDFQSSELKFFRKLPPLSEMHPSHGPFLHGLFKGNLPMFSNPSV